MQVLTLISSVFFSWFIHVDSLRKLILTGLRVILLLAGCNLTQVGWAVKCNIGFLYR